MELVPLSRWLNPHLIDLSAFNIEVLNGGLVINNDHVIY